MILADLANLVACLINIFVYTCINFRWVCFLHSFWNHSSYHSSSFPCVFITSKSDTRLIVDLEIKDLEFPQVSSGKVLCTLNCKNILVTSIVEFSSKIKSWPSLFTRIVMLANWFFWWLEMESSFWRLVWDVNFHFTLNKQLWSPICLVVWTVAKFLCSTM